MKLYVIRHGAVTPGTRGGWSSTPLSSEGILGVENLAEKLSNMNINVDRIVSSDIVRAKQTAEIVSKKLSLPIVYDSLWREYNNGDIANMKDEDADKKFPHLIFVEMGYDTHYPNGESPHEYFDRIYAQYEKIKKENKDVLLITHGGVIDVIYHIVNGLKWSNNSQHKRIYKNAEVYIFEI